MEATLKQGEIQLHGLNKKNNNKKTLGLFKTEEISLLKMDVLLSIRGLNFAVGGHQAKSVFRTFCVKSTLFQVLVPAQIFQGAKLASNIQAPYSTHQLYSSCCKQVEVACS